MIARTHAQCGAVILAVLLSGCAGSAQRHPFPAALMQMPAPPPATRPTTRPVFATRPGEPLLRQGDEIMVCGQLFHTGAPVVLWLDPGGYDAYRLEKRFDKSPAATQPAVGRSRFNVRDLTEAEMQRIRESGWELDFLRQKVDQFVIHYDACGTSRQCFAILHDHRNLSAHFLLDLDGTIYQTLDLKERAWHATISNSRSIGIEIANIGAYQRTDAERLRDWYVKDPDGQMRVNLPARLGDGGIRTLGFVARPARPNVVFGTIQNHRLRQYDFTPEQYDSLAKLTATLCTVFPQTTCDYPKDADGKLVPQKLTDAQLATYRGLLGHFHIQTDKVDPGPAFQWDKLIREARGFIKDSDRPATRPTIEAPATRPATTDTGPPAAGERN